MQTTEAEEAAQRASVFNRWRLPSDDLLRDPSYRRLWLSILMSSLGGQVSMLALPLTAALLLNASPTQMGLLIAAEIAPFVLLSLPAGVWLDRARKLPVYIAGEALMALALLTVPVAWWLGWLGMTWMYCVAFAMGCVHVVAGSAAQTVLTQIVPRERLVQAHARNALAGSSADVLGPGLAGALIKAVGAPVALVVDAVMLIVSVAILRGLNVVERLAAQGPMRFMPELREGLNFVRQNTLLVAAATTVGLWQMFHHAAVVVQILFATRELHMNESQVGLAFIGLGVGTVAGGFLGDRVATRLGPGPTLLLGVAITAVGWAALAVAPTNALGVWVFAAMLMCFGLGAVLIFINFLALRQSVTPDALLGRMTSTMRWLILLPAGPGALIGGWLGEHVGLRASLAFAGGGALVLALVSSRLPYLMKVKHLPKLPAPTLAPTDSVISAPDRTDPLHP
jgi:MFS family permease